ncbi:LysR family transcriptional regulator [Nocardiopsis sp. HNM0947]|uniref:LysR family transcriptional regulator n=1 Tax=Nocardiopsis coralli TaxID=2772213 RepID=A0ABR9PCT1_9ACTN|nr:LysR substrate-binding domain-containing protein [Nocardiopsis coralli]MBE3001535.1 LysR family transcriptional regulator [Nocardiopsis coralli]
MELRQLTAVVAVSETGSVTAAARRLHVVQPAVTRQIRTLEEELGAPLFHRTNQGMVPTEAGEVLLEHARRALHELDLVRTEIRPGPREVSGVVRLGLLESTVDLLAPHLVRGLAELHPGVELRLMSGYSGHLQRWLDDGDVDLSLLYDLAATPSLSVTPLAEENLWLVAPPEAGLSPERPLPWAQAWRHPLVLPVAGHGLRVLIDRARPDDGTGPTVVTEVNAMRIQKALVEAGQGWTVLPAAGVAPDIAAGTLSGAPLTGPEVSRSVVLGLPLGRRVPPAVRAVAAHVADVARELVASGAWPGASAGARDTC